MAINIPQKTSLVDSMTFLADRFLASKEKDRDRKHEVAAQDKEIGLRRDQLRAEERIAQRDNLLRRWVAGAEFSLGLGQQALQGAELLQRGSLARLEDSRLRRGQEFEREVGLDANAKGVQIAQIQGNAQVAASRPPEDPVVKHRLSLLDRLEGLGPRPQITVGHGSYQKRDGGQGTYHESEAQGQLLKHFGVTAEELASYSPTDWKALHAKVRTYKPAGGWGSSGERTTWKDWGKNVVEDYIARGTEAASRVMEWDNTYDEVMLNLGLMDNPAPKPGDAGIKKQIDKALTAVQE